MSIGGIGGIGGQHSQIYSPQAYHPAQLQRKRPTAEKTALTETSFTAKNPVAQPKQRAIPKALEGLVSDVQTMAGQLGYLDVSPQAIVAAYQEKQSFLADVRA